MNVEVFCYIGLLRYPEQLGSSIALLADEERKRAEEFLAKVKSESRQRLLLRWSEVRDREGVELRRRIRESKGVELESLPPTFRRWCIEWLNNNGREDHQK